MKQNKALPIIIGGFLGAIMGVIAAFLFLRQTEKTETGSRITASQGVKAGMGILNLLRMISDLGKGKG